MAWGGAKKGAVSDTVLVAEVTCSLVIFLSTTLTLTRLLCAKGVVLEFVAET